MKKLSLLIVSIVLLNGCYLFDGSSRFNHLDKQKEQKLNLINQLIFNSESYDSLLHNSEFYHPSYSILMNPEDVEGKDGIAILKAFKNEVTNHSDLSDYISKVNQDTIHTFLYLGNNQNIIFNKNVATFNFILKNNKWYIQYITKGNYLLEEEDRLKRSK